MKIAIFYSYNGSKFSGSQTQPNLNTVEDRLNLALNHIGIFEPVISSSRTDKGVHALMQVSTTHCGDFWDLNKLKYQLNKHSAPFIKISKVICVNESFHPRYGAKARQYAYFISLDEFNPFLADFVTYKKSVNLELLNKALKHFIGEKDFKIFRKTGSNEKSTIREIYQAKAYQRRIYGLNLIVIKFKANGFLRSQVRMMVANALFAAKNEANLNKFKSNLDLQIPCTKIPAPAQGLYLQKIFY